MKTKSVRPANGLVILSMIIMTALLCALGTWQVSRLHWKEALIARVNERLSTEPVALSELPLTSNPGDLEYSPVSLTGSYQDNCENFEFTTHEGQSGWNIFSPMQLSPGTLEGRSMIMVNRGFVPYNQRDAVRNQQNNEVLNQEITGLLRVPIGAKPGYFVNDNDIAAKTFFWRDINAMIEACGLALSTFAPVYVDNGIPGNPSPADSLPIPGTTIVSFPNNHLQYAITWYGLALALLGVGSYFLYGRRNRT
jgi:surfeit locus 1 family protein